MPSMSTVEIELRRSIGALVDEAEKLVNLEDPSRSMTEEENTRFGQINTEVGTLKDRLDQVKSTAALRSEFGATPPVERLEPVGEQTRDAGTWAEQFMRSESFQNLRSNNFGHGEARVTLDGTSFRALIDNVTSTSGAAFTQPSLQTQMPLAVPDRQLRLIDVIPHGTTSDNVILYVQDTTSSVAGDTAAETAEGGLKPESTETFNRVIDPVQTIPAWMKVTRQAAEDHNQIMSYLQGRLVYRVWRRLDNQVINGDGVGVNLLGLLNRSGISTYAPAVAEARVFSIRKAETIAQQAEQEPTVIVVNPADMEKFDLAVAAGSGEFLTQNGARVNPPPTMWGMRAVWSNAIGAGTGMLIDPTVAMLWDRKQPTVYLTDSDGTDFRQNILTLLVELRAGLSLFQPKGVVKVTFNGTT